MSDAITFSLNDRNVPLALTMRRYQAIRDGAGDTPGIDDAARILWVLAGGEDGTGLTLDAFLDTITPRALAEAVPLIEAVMQRDGGDAGKAKARQRKA